MPASLQDLLRIRSRRSESFAAALEAACALPNLDAPEYFLDRTPSELFVNPRLLKPGDDEGNYWEKLDQPSDAPIVIRGPRKTGKSLLLKMIAHYVARRSLEQLDQAVLLADDIIFPIYIDLAKARNPESGTLKDESLSSIKGMLSPYPIDAAMKETVYRWVADRFDDLGFSRFVFLFDHLERSGVKAWMTKPFTKPFKDHGPRIYMASNPDFRVPSVRSRYEILPFHEEAIDQFIMNWAGPLGPANALIKPKMLREPAFKELMRHPYLLTLACEAVTNSSKRDFNAVYDEAEKLGLWKRPDVPPPPVAPQPRRKPKPIVWIVLAAAAVVCLALGAHFFLQPRPPKSGDEGDVATAIKIAQMSDVRESSGKEASIAPVATRPSIQIKQVPLQIRTGSTIVDIGGEVHGADLALCRVLVYSHTDRWYIQPDRNGAIDIDSNGHWQGDIHGGSRYAAILVSQGFQPPLKTDRLPPLGTEGVLAIDEVNGK